MVTMTRKFISFAVCLSVLVLTLASNAAPARAATTITVGDDGARCHGSVSTIQAAVTALGPNPTGKIVVCAGVYTTATLVTGANKLTIQGKPGAILRAPASFATQMITVQDSQKVTITGFTIDGQGSLGVAGSTAGTTAIYILRSSVTITKNSIINWHTASFGTATVYMSAIKVIENAGQAVTISKNTITDFQTLGIGLSGPAKVNISGNTLSTTGTSADKPVGIMMSGNTMGGKIAKNTITSDQFPAGTYEQTAIWVLESSKVGISANKITHWYWGIVVEADGYSNIPANDNKVSGNKINETAVGIFLRSNAWGTFDAHADRNKITGNKIVNTATAGEYGIIVFGGDPAGGPSCYAQDEVIKGNTITHFAQSVVTDASGGLIISGVFAPNTLN